MDTDIIRQSDFIKIGKQLQDNKKYLEVAKDLDDQRKKLVILDRKSKDPYLIRYYYLNFRPFARITIHNILRSDVDGLHDHPWPFQTYILNGGYWEETPKGRFWRGPGHHGLSLATDYHRLSIDKELTNGEETWTLFMMGPKQKEWGFLNKENQWEHWQDYLGKRENVE